jgi:hypothetical protein
VLAKESASPPKAAVKPRAIEIADRGCVIVHGKIAFADSSAEELNNNELVPKFYLRTLGRRSSAARCAQCVVMPIVRRAPVLAVDVVSAAGSHLSRETHTYLPATEEHRVADVTGREKPGSRR